MSDDKKKFFNSNKLLFNNVRFITNISIYQIKLKLFFMLSIQ